MHVLGQYGRENAGALFDLFLECMPEYPIDKPDQNGNTGRFHRNCMFQVKFYSTLDLFSTSFDIVFSE